MPSIRKASCLLSRSFEAEKNALRMEANSPISGPLFNPVPPLPAPRRAEGVEHSMSWPQARTRVFERAGWPPPGLRGFRSSYNHPIPTAHLLPEFAMPQRLSRRRFLQTTAAGAIGFWAASSPAAGRKVSANEKLNLGVIGVAGRGASNLGGVSGEAIVALCDVDEGRAAQARQRFPQAQFHADFRRLIDQKGLDGVV